MKRARRRTRRTLVFAMIVCLMLAACGSGESILRAGNDDPAPGVDQPSAGPGPTSPGQSPAPELTVPGQPAVPDQPAGPTVPTVPAVAPAVPTTLLRPLDSLPPCRVDALAEAGADGPVEVLFWHAMSNELGRELEQITNEYNASQSMVRVQLEFQGDYELAIDKYLQSNTDNRPDLAQIPEYATQLMIDTASHVPVQACAEDSGYSAGELLGAAVRVYSSEGVQWSMPFNLSNPVLYFNRKIFREAGLDDTAPPQTLADVGAAGLAIQASGAADFGIALESSPNAGGGWVLEQWLAKEGEFYSNNDNGRSAPSDRVLFDSPRSAAMLAEAQGLLTTGGGIYVGENPGGQDALLKMADGSAPASMAIASSAALGPVLQAVSNGLIPGVGADDLGIGPMPSPNGAQGALIGGASLWLTAGRGDAKVAAAWDFITYLVSREVQSRWAAATGYVPVNSAAIDIEPLRSLYVSDPRFRVAFDQVALAPDVASFTGPVLGPLREVRALAAQAVGQTLAGADPATALASAATLANELIRNYNATRN